MHSSTHELVAFTPLSPSHPDREPGGGDGVPSPQVQIANSPQAVNQLEGVVALRGVLRDIHTRQRGADAWKYCCGLFCRWSTLPPSSGITGASSPPTECTAPSPRVGALIVLGLLINTQELLVVKEVHALPTCTATVTRRIALMRHTIRKLAMVEPRHASMAELANRSRDGPHSPNTSHGMSSNALLGNGPRIAFETCCLPIDNVQLVDGRLLLFEKYFPCVSLEQLLQAPRRVARRSVGLASSSNSGSGTTPSVPQVQPAVPSGFGTEIISRKRLVSFVAIGILRSVVRGLKKLHDNDIAHRHLRPSSVLVSSDFHVRLDNVEHLSTRSPLTDPELWIWYAPEVSAHDLDDATQSAVALEKWKRCDVFAFGLLVYYLHTGKQPFDALLKGNRHASIDAAGVTFLPKMLGCRSRWADYKAVGLDGLSESSAGRHSELLVLAKRCLCQSPAERPTVEQLSEHVDRIAARLPDVRVVSESEPQQQSNTDSSSPSNTQTYHPPSDHASYLPAMVSTSRTVNTGVSSGSTYAAASKNVLSQTDPNALASKTVQQDENETTNWIADMCFKQGMQFEAIQQRTTDNTTAASSQHNPLSSGYILGITASRHVLSNNSGAQREHCDVLVECCVGPSGTRKVTQKLVEFARNNLICERDSVASTFREHSVAYRLARMDEENGMVVMWSQLNAVGTSDDNDDSDGALQQLQPRGADAVGVSSTLVDDRSERCGQFVVRIVQTFVIPCDSDTSEGYDQRQEARSLRPTALLCARMGLSLCVCASVVVLVVLLTLALA